MVSTASFLIACALFSQSPPEESLQTRWRREYPAAAARLIEATTNIIAEGRGTHSPFRGDLRTTASLTYKANATSAVFIGNDATTEPPGEPLKKDLDYVFCRTPETEFELFRKDAAHPYTIRSFVPTASLEPPPPFGFIEGRNRRVRAATTYRNWTLLERMESPTFRVIEMKPIEKDRRKLVRLDYTYRNEYTIEKGFVLLDPDRSWAIREVDLACEALKFKGSNQFVMSVDYFDEPEVRLFPRRAAIALIDPPTQRAQKYEVEYATAQRVVPPPESFRLSGYGLPDVPLNPPPPRSVFSWRSPWFWLLAGIAVVLGALAWGRRPRWMAGRLVQRV